MPAPGEPSTPRRSIAVVTGPTRGHVYPAWATAEAYRRAVGDLDVLVIDTPLGLAARLLPPGDWRHAPVSGSPLAGVGARGKLRAMARALRATGTVRRLLQAQRSRVVIAFGSYVTGAAVLAARSLGLATAIHEANAVAGLANRLAAPFATRVYLAFPSAARAFPGRRCRRVGHPVRAAIQALAREPRQPPPGGRPARVLVVGGASFLAEHVPALLAHVSRQGVKLDVLHEAPGVDPGRLEAAYRAAGIQTRVTAEIADIASAYRWADFAIARAGAGTVTELGIAGLPALLVPLASAAADHQAANARAAAESGGAWWTPEREWRSEALGEQIGTVLRDPSLWSRASAGARRHTVVDAAERLVADCEAMMAGRW